ncbi:MAG TPA: glycoside hydrolase family 15 protein [Acidimicrobiales bacterium]|jgi:GH15 family glucan-1,4-alpha-glucosidase|nr:glycoside hydrolase family 15 protein [Acidimicrobiales bacterium]
MPSRIEDYAIIGDTKTVALVDRTGSIDWWCAPRIDSGAAFAALLGDASNGRWLIAPKGAVTKVTRRYEPDTLILETIFETSTGSVSVTDFMPPHEGKSMIHRIVEGRGGSVEMQMELIVRYEYGAITPWATATGDGQVLVAGRDGLRLHSPIRLEGKENTTVASFTLSGDMRRPFSLTWFASEIHAPLPLDSLAARNHTRHYWHNWVARCTYKGGWRDQVVRSLITLKALTYEPTGAVCAAATTSLPETIGGNRNWDYRFSWLRDSTFTLHALLLSGYTDEAGAWVQWLRRAVAGNPDEMQIMYGVDGERRLAEFELDHLAGYEGAKPVRVGNEAATQFQLDIYGEIMDSAVTSWRGPILQQFHASPDLMLAILRHLETVWREPDNGIWEVRGPRRHFTHSKVMAWVGFDRGVSLAQDDVLPKERIDHWRQLRDEIHAEVCEKGFDAELNSFTQYYGSKLLDASLLMLAPVGFLPPDDPRVAGTIEAIQKGLVTDGFVRRYQTDTDEDVDGLQGTEGAFLMTSFWLADNLVLLGRHDEAREMFERLCALCNDVGLLSEEYDPESSRLLGNFPQAFSHVSLINTAANLSMAEHGPSAMRSRRYGPPWRRRAPTG